MKKNFFLLLAVFLSETNVTARTSGTNVISGGSSRQHLSPVAPVVTTDVSTTAAPVVTTDVSTTAVPLVTTAVPTTATPLVTTAVPTTASYYEQLKEKINSLFKKIELLNKKNDELEEVISTTTASLTSTTTTASPMSTTTASITTCPVGSYLGANNICLSALNKPVYVNVTYEGLIGIDTDLGPPGQTSPETGVPNNEVIGYVDKQGNVIQNINSRYSRNKSMSALTYMATLLRYYSGTSTPLIISQVSGTMKNGEKIGRLMSDGSVIVDTKADGIFGYDSKGNGNVIPNGTKFGRL